MESPDASKTTSIYFELSWSILSSIGLVNFVYGFLVIGIVGLSPISLVPMIVSAAGAVANGMCYYSSYGDYSVTRKAVAGVFADLMWLVCSA